MRETRRQWGGCVWVALIVLGVFLLTPVAIGYVYLESMRSQAMSNNEKIVALFADRLEESWGAKLPDAGDVTSPVGEVSIYSTTRSARHLSLKVVVGTSKGNFFGTTDFIRCYSLTFEELQLGLFRHTVKLISPCPHEKG